MRRPEDGSFHSQGQGFGRVKALEAIDPRQINSILEQLRQTLPAQRWFRSKDKTVKAVRLEDGCVYEVSHKRYWIFFLCVDYGETDSEIYFTPLVSLNKRTGEFDEVSAKDILAEVSWGGEEIALIDALSEGSFRKWWLEALSQNRVLETGKGRLKFYGKPTLAGALNPNAVQIERLNAEQSNTSIVIGRKWILKMFRKPESGISPEVEMLEFLNRHGYPYVPVLEGEIRIERKSGEKASLGIMQNFIENQGDGWCYALGNAKQFIEESRARFPDGPQAAESEGDDCLEPFAREIKSLGILTGQMHLTLDRATGDAAFDPEKITGFDIGRWAASYQKLLGEVLEVLKKKTQSGSAHPDEPMYARILENEDVLAKAPHIMNRMLSGKTNKIRHHGDYHLGQVLKTGNGWVLFDFEGEPLRGLEERKQKTCPLKDVAGMLRSFSYAAHMAAAQYAQKNPETKNQTAVLGSGWEARMRESYLEGYFEAAGKEQGSFLLPSIEENRKITSFFELDKAVYELHYELNNRPEWVWIPVLGIERLLGNQSFLSLAREREKP